jgi:hypothetical protein
MRTSIGYSITETPDNDIVLVGRCTKGLIWVPSMFSFFGSAAYPLNVTHGLLLKLKEDGAVHLCQLYGGANIDIDQFASVNTIGMNKHEHGIIVGGTSESFPPLVTPPKVSGERIWVLKLDLNGNTSHNMACMLHKADVETIGINIQKMEQKLEIKKLTLKEKILPLKTQDFPLKEYFLCP